MAGVVGLAICVAGCQQRELVAPPPSFDAPLVHTEPATLPQIQPETPATQPQPEIAQLSHDLIDSEALKPAVRPRPWRYIVVHHSDTEYGSAARFHKSHLARGWDALGYDFVIGNGTDTGDGVIEVGPRWIKQLPGAHTGTPDKIYNDFGIGICLVGNFDENQPTPRQIDSLARLCAYMMKTYSIPPERIIGHRDAKSTNCPGKNLDIRQVREMAANYLRQAP